MKKGRQPHGYVLKFNIQHIGAVRNSDEEVQEVTDFLCRSHCIWMHVRAS